MIVIVYTSLIGIFTIIMTLLGLLALLKLMKSHPRSIVDHRELLLYCLDDDDVTIRMKALELIAGIVSKKSMTILVHHLMQVYMILVMMMMEVVVVKSVVASLIVLIIITMSISDNIHFIVMQLLLLHYIQSILLNY